jgi:uncharacterized protein (DUF302 family)
MHPPDRAHRMLHSGSRSKSKPFDISVRRLTASSSPPILGRVISSQEEQVMFTRLFHICAAALFAYAVAVSPPDFAQAGNDGIVRVRSAYPISETVERLKKDIAGKGIKFFSEIDQAKLAADAGIKLQPSVLLIFGNPPLGTQFITANGNAGLDWPVRLLVFENEKGEVWTAYTDFDWIARRHGIKNRKDQFKTASGVIVSITSSVQAK